ncbi:hypothetical protein Taro_024039 [Colocasia esculenta]|uniref:Uncharacterized protein n=1 Tax=Colocasia esculenta TaxID=4460 RepID=A0A843V5R4_COLES|nr:hypothetical protein [Colocasia esculenta]
MVELRSGKCVEIEEILSASGARVDTSRGWKPEQLAALALWLTGARGKTLVCEAELDRAENSGSGGDSREKASRDLARIEVWQNFLHASEVSSQQAVLSLLP